MTPRTILESAHYHFSLDLDPLFESIESECSHCLNSSIPLYKQLPSQTLDIQRIKLRHRRPDDFHLQINEAFNVSKLYERSLTCYTNTGRDLIDGHDWFAIFPPNGFRYLYNPACESLNDLRDLDPTLLKQVVDIGYLSERLQQHQHLDPEVILFDMSVYYAVRV